VRPKPKPVPMDSSHRPMGLRPFEQICVLGGLKPECQGAQVMPDATRRGRWPQAFAARDWRRAWVIAQKATKIAGRGQKPMPSHFGILAVKAKV